MSKMLQEEPALALQLPCVKAGIAGDVSKRF